MAMTDSMLIVSNEFFPCVTDQAAIGIVDIEDMKILIHEDKSFPGCFDDSPEFFLAFAEFFLGQFPLGNVHDDALVMGFFPALISDNGRVVFHPSDFAVFCQDAVEL